MVFTSLIRGYSSNITAKLSKVFILMLIRRWNYIQQNLISTYHRNKFSQNEAVHLMLI